MHFTCIWEIWEFTCVHVHWIKPIHMGSTVKPDDAITICSLSASLSSFGYTPTHTPTHTERESEKERETSRLTQMDAAGGSAPQAAVLRCCCSCTGVKKRRARTGTTVWGVFEQETQKS